VQCCASYFQTVIH